jgi:hypothetical protein
MLRRLLFRNFKLIYKSSRWIRHRFTATGLLVFTIMIIAGVFGIDTRQTMAFQIFALMATLLLLALISIVSFRGRFRIHRILPEFATVGQPLRYRCVIENLISRKQKGLLLIDELDTDLPEFNEFLLTRDPQGIKRNWFDRFVGYPKLVNLIQKKRGGSIKPVGIDFISARGRADSHIRLTPIRRGYLNFHSTRVARADPLGLIRAFKKINLKNTMLVLPRLYNVPPIQLQGNRKYQHGGMNLASSVGDSQEFMSLREYRPGDPMRSIHWKSYAKRTQPIVKEYQDEFFVRQGLILDTFTGPHTEEVFEGAVSVAAAYRFTSGRGLSTTERMLEILACVEPCQESSFDRLHQLVLEHGTESSGFICVLLGWDENRQSFVRLLETMTVPSLVLVITDDGVDDSRDITTISELVRIHVLNASEIQIGLDNIQL